MAKQDGSTEPEPGQPHSPDAPKPKEKGGRIRRTPDVGLWAVRGVHLETRALSEKGANRAGKTMGQFVNEDIRSLVWPTRQIRVRVQRPMRNWRRTSTGVNGAAMKRNGRRRPAQLITRPER